MPLQHLRIRIAQGLEQSRGRLDVGEEQCHDPRALHRSGLATADWRRKRCNAGCARPHRPASGRDEPWQARHLMGRDCKGLHCIRQLLLHPGQELHVLDLVGLELEAGDQRPGRNPVPNVGLPVLDDEAKGAYRRRLSELREERRQTRSTTAGAPSGPVERSTPSRRNWRPPWVWAPRPLQPSADTGHYHLLHLHARSRSPDRLGPVKRHPSRCEARLHASSDRR